MRRGCPSPVDSESASQTVLSSNAEATQKSPSGVAEALRKFIGCQTICANDTGQLNRKNARRAAQGMSNRECCLKRHIVRELYPLILADLSDAATIT